MKQTDKKRNQSRIVERKTKKLLESHGNTMVLLTIASVILSVIIGIAVLSPLLFTAAVFPFFFSTMKLRDHRWAVILVFRWAIALFVTILVVGVFVPGRAESSIPLAAGAVATIKAWLNVPGAAPPADLPYMLWGMVLFVAGSAVSGGLLGFLVGSIAIGGAAYGALFIFRHGYNILQISLVSIPLWQLSLFVAGGFLLVPVSHLAFQRFLNVEKDPRDWTLLRNCMYMGAGFFLLSLVFRYATAGPWRSLLERWTVM
ncbi:MAG: hypothetical protein P8181_05835 [bacterium]